MKFELFFAKKIIKRDKSSFSKPIIRISILAIALGIAMMTLSLSIVNGFQKEIRTKISGFGAHLNVSNYESSGVLDKKPISKNRNCFTLLDTLKGISYYQNYVYRTAIIKNLDSNHGILIKGIDDTFNWTFFEKYIIEGSTLSFSNEYATNKVLISKKIATKLNLSLNDEILIYFVQQPARFRKLKISGIYNTGLGELDEKVILTDIRHLQKVNSWGEDQVGGIEIFLDDFSQLDKMENQVYKNLDYDLNVNSIKKTRIDIFNWLELQDINILIIIGLLLLVCGINIISTLLILIIERTNSIGILKAIGANSKSIRKIFIINASYLIVQGILIGNFLGIGISLTQLHFGILKLPQEAYFIDKVPILIEPVELIILNSATLTFCILLLIIPSNIIAKVEPIKSIRFD